MATASSTFDGTENPLSEGAAWVGGPGAWAPMQKTSGVAHGSSGQSSLARYVGTSFGDDQFSRVTFSGTSAGTYPTVNTRINGNTDGDCYAAEVDPGDTDNVAIYRVSDTGSLSYTQIGSDLILSGNIVAGDTFEMQSVGDTHEVFRNGVSAGTRTDATFASGQPGIGSYNNFPAFTAWEGGDLGSSEDTPLDAGHGAFAVTGQAASFAIGMAAAHGSFSVSGQAASFDIRMVAETGMFTVAGQSATLDWSEAEAGSYRSLPLLGCG